MAKIKDITGHLESFAPIPYQESYDNSGLIVGNPQQEVSGVLIALDCTEPVVEEAMKKGCNLIVAHHPIVFKGLKKFNGSNYVERTVIKAIQSEVAIYAIHTNLDNVALGVNHKIATLLGLQNIKILSPKSGELMKLTVFVPVEHKNKVLEAMHKAGAGMVGKYENCSFSIEGEGTFKGKEGANPVIGTVGEQELVKEMRIEVLLPSHKAGAVVASMKASHPYEEVAYYLQAVENKDDSVGAGSIGVLAEPMEGMEFLKFLKKRMALNCIRYTKDTGKKIRKVAVCGGSGSFLLSKAKAKGADVFITADFKYHEFFDAEKDLIIADIGHYESEVFTKELIYEIINKKFTKFAVNLSEENTNPISYL